MTSKFFPILMQSTCHKNTSMNLNRFQFMGNLTIYATNKYTERLKIPTSSKYHCNYQHINLINSKFEKSYY